MSTATQPRDITIFGSTGSIGQSTLDLIGRNPDAYNCIALTAHSNVDELARQAQHFGADVAVIADEALYPDLKAALSGSGIEAAAGLAAIDEAAERPADWVMAAIVGAAGLSPTLKALERGATVALANKECMVCAGELVTDVVMRSGARLLPVDSEHNAIFQVFDFAAPERVHKVILTASGGPFRTRTLEQMRDITPQQAVAHPVWSMGAKISVDSATLMNKGLELIEAYHLFPVEPDQLDVLVHPQSVVHSLVEYIDGSVLAQLGTPDMRTPISFALAYPNRLATPCSRLNLAEIGQLTFEAADPTRFPALELAWSALRAGGGAPAVLNAANEVAVAAFLERQISFLDIVAVVSDVMTLVPQRRPTNLADVVALDRLARTTAREQIMRRRQRA